MKVHAMNWVPLLMNGDIIILSNYRLHTHSQTLCLVIKQSIVLLRDVRRIGIQRYIGESGTSYRSPKRFARILIVL